MYHVKRADQGSDLHFWWLGRTLLVHRRAALPKAKEKHRSDKNRAGREKSCNTTTRKNLQGDVQNCL